MIDFRLKREVRCPGCGKRLDGARAVTGNTAPQPGDFTVCIRCAIVLRFTEELGLMAVDQKDVPKDLVGPLRVAQAIVRAAYPVIHSWNN